MPDDIPLFSFYEHHGRLVWVHTRLKGSHRTACLCQSCQWFMPENPENPDLYCTMARTVHALCVEFGLVTPVWECPHFVEDRADDVGSED